MKRLPVRVSRRALLKLSLAASGLVGVGLIARFLGYEEPPPAPQRYTLGAPGEYPIGTVVPIPEARIVLGRDEVGFYALSIICTHLGCTVVQSGGILECPCHGSRFTNQGLVLKGPASRPLPAYEVSASADMRLVVHVGTEVPLSQRLAVGG